MLPGTVEGGLIGRAHLYFILFIIHPFIFVDLYSMSRVLIFILEQGTNCTGYIGEFEIVDDHRGGKIVIQLNGRLNKCGVISPRFNITVDAIENWGALLLPARSFGKMILTTSSGIMDHEEARRKHVRIICFCGFALVGRWRR